MSSRSRWATTQGIPGQFGLYNKIGEGTGRIGRERDRGEKEGGGKEREKKRERERERERNSVMQKLCPGS